MVMTPRHTSSDDDEEDDDDDDKTKEFFFESLCVFEEFMSGHGA